MTAAGVSAGIDMALTLAARIAGEEVAKAIQLGIEYDPQPPFDAGSVEKSDPAVVEAIRARSWPSARRRRGSAPPPPRGQTPKRKGRTVRRLCGEAVAGWLRRAGASGGVAKVRRP